MDTWLYSEQCYSSQWGRSDLLQQVNFFDYYANHMIYVNSEILRISHELISMSYELRDLKQKNYEIRCELANLDYEKAVNYEKVMIETNIVQTSAGNLNSCDGCDKCVLNEKADENDQPIVTVQAVHSSKQRSITRLILPLRRTKWEQYKRKFVSRIKRARKHCKQQQWDPKYTTPSAGTILRIISRRAIFYNGCRNLEGENTDADEDGNSEDVKIDTYDVENGSIPHHRSPMVVRTAECENREMSTPLLN